MEVSFTLTGIDFIIGAYLSIWQNSALNAHSFKENTSLRAGLGRLTSYHQK